jgi:hydrogenase nickel incorporation protein HypB
MAGKTIEVAQGILDKNDRIAARLRERYVAHKVCALNLLAGPGAGKTSTIVATIDALKDRYRVAVIEGDIASDVDARTVKAHGAAAVQINTGGLCHLEGDMIEQALDVLDLDQTDLIIIENVGNLVCTVDFDLGQNLTAMILSVPEGDDKILKYPGIFQAADAVVLNKLDTLPVFSFNMAAFDEGMANVNPNAPVFKLSATSGAGVDAWVDFLVEQIEQVKGSARS